jgi:spore coat polysaccharide biosynthesis protein SpsF
MGSSRLPGKVMKQVMGKPLLGYLIDRVKLVGSIDEIVVATPVGVDNDVIERYCIEEDIVCYRGSEHDVLDRTLQALKSVDATVGVEVYGDCPLIDYRIIENVIAVFLSNPQYDFVSNDLKTTYPPGMEVEVFNFNALNDSSNRLSDDHPDREHGTLYIRQNPTRYKIKNITASVEHFRPDLELEVDAAEDLDLISMIIEHFCGDPKLSLSEIITYIDTVPDLASINKNVHRRWKKYRND